MSPVIKVENLSKYYRLGLIGGKTLHDDLNRWWARVRKQPDPLLKIGQEDRRNGNGEYIWALQDVSFEVKQGEIVGIIGRNGAGKSTLLKILSRITAPTSGQVKVKGRIASLLEVGTGFHPELTGRENIYLNGAILGMKKAEIDRKFDEIVAFAEVEKFIDTPVKRYSSGMHVRLAFAVAAHLEPEILVVDEVLAVGDIAFQKKCLGKMGDVAKAGRTVLFVSHNMAAVQNLCNKAMLLNTGRIDHAGSVNETISMYVGDVETNRVTFTEGPIRTAYVRQIGSEIEIGVVYQFDRILRTPNLGFVISDYSGIPICGTNRLEERLPSDGHAGKSGMIKVFVESPKLRDAVYRLSLWFGDGKEDFFQARDCLKFQVQTMSPVNQIYPALLVGTVLPKCRWQFD